MQVKVEDVSTVKKIIHIEIDQEMVSSEISKAYQDLKKRAKVKGFRPGKAPRSVLERLYGKDVNADVASRLIQESLMGAIRDADLKILGAPQIDPPDLKDQSPYKFEATVEVSPELGAIEFDGLELKKTMYEVNDEEIQAQLEMLQKNLAYHKDIEEDRTVRKDDIVLIDYEGFIDDKPFEETQKTENFTLKIGDGQILDAFDDQLIDMKPEEEKSFDITFPEDYFNPKLAGQTIAFQVALKGIREQVIPPISDELAKRLGKYETLEDLKKAITENLQEGYTKRAEQELNEQIFEALISRKDFEVPEVLVESELDAIVEEAERSFAYHNKSMVDAGLTTEGLKEKYRGTAEKQVKRYILLNKVIEQENITISGEDLENGYAEMAKAFGQPVEQIKHYYNENRDKLDFFRHTLLEKQAIKLIIERSHITEVAPEREASQESAEAAEAPR